VSEKINIEDETLVLRFTVNEVNGILSALGQLPYTQSATIIGMIHAQAGRQVEQLIENAKEKKDES
jgi:hypothetical protein